MAAQTPLGARLRAGRERIGMTVLQAAEKLHLDSRMLEALEAERFEGFGAPVFVRGHLKNYADLIEEPFAELLGLFEARSAALMPDLTRTSRLPRTLNRGRWLKPAMLLIGAVVLALTVWWVLMRRGR